ncbi:MAG: histidine kinase [Bacteroidota bacterium]
MRRGLITSICTFLAIGTFAQLRFDRPVVYTTEDGLAGDRVTVIEKGKHGFLWVGTNEGLSRFDGQQFRNYQRNIEDPNAIFNNSITCVLPEEEEVWIGHHGGLSKLNLETEKFTNYQFTEQGKLDSTYMEHSQITHALLRDSDGTLWVGSRYYGIAKYLPEEDDFKVFPYEGNEPLQVFGDATRSKNIYNLKADINNDSIIWAGCGAGLYKFNKYTETLKWFYFDHPTMQGRSARNAIRHLNVHDNGLLYYGTWSAGVNIFDPKTNTFSSLPVKPEKSRALLPIDANIAEVKRKSKDELWIKWGHRIMVYNVNTYEVYLYATGSLKEPIGMHCIDEQNRAWSKSNKGLYMFDPVTQQFPHYTFEEMKGVGDCYTFAVLPSPDNKTINLIARHCNGFYQFDLENRTFTGTKFPTGLLNQHGDFYITGLEYYSENEWLIPYYRGMISFNPKTRTFKSAPISPKTKRNAYGNIFKDSKDHFWWGTEGDGFIKWKGKNHNPEIIHRDLFPGKSKLPTTRVSSFLEDNKGHVWLNRRNGFSVYLPERDTFLNFINSENPKIAFPVVQDFAEDRVGRIWMTGHGGWVGYAYAERPEDGIIEKMYMYSKTETEFTSMVLESDPDGDIWILASNELIKIEAQTLKQTRFSLEYGAENIDLFSLSILPTGELVLGTRFGLMMAHPDDLVRNQEKPEPYVTAIEINNQPVIAPTAIKNGYTLDLNPQENFFLFGFSAKSFTLSQYNKFRYRLKGFQEEWNDAKDRRFVNYTNVPSGDYTFQLQTANNEGVWNESLFEVNVNIKTPWWDTLAAKLIGFFLLSGLVFFIYRSRVEQIKKRAKMKTEFEKQLASVEMSALRAQMNPHFLFNCLNSIERFVIKNETQKASEYLNNFARLIRLILQNSRSNYIVLKDELEALGLYMEMEALRFGQKFDYEVIIDEEVDVDSISIPPMLFQPYVENAIWHGLMAKKEKGKVELKLSRKNGMLNCIIDDNGIGRQKAQELKSKNQRKDKKSMGMTITKNRIAMINKLYDTNTSIKIFDKKDKKGIASGTRVELNIPI